METLLLIFSWILANWMAVLLGVQGLLVAALGLALIIPGNQPDAFLQRIVDVLKKISNK